MMIEENVHFVSFRYELDGIEQTEKYPPSFRVTLETNSSKRTPSNEQEYLNQQLNQTFQRPQSLFKDENEFRQTIEEYGKNIKNLFFCSFFLLFNK